MIAVSKFSKNVSFFGACMVSRLHFYMNRFHVLYCFQDCTHVHKSKAAINKIKVACSSAIFDKSESQEFPEKKFCQGKKKKKKGKRKRKKISANHRYLTWITFPIQSQHSSRKQFC